MAPDIAAADAVDPVDGLRIWRLGRDIVAVGLLG